MEEVIRKAADVLGRHRAGYAVIGGIAVFAWGQPRTTLDVDFVIALSPANLELIVADFADCGFSVPKDAVKRLRQGLAVKLKMGPYSADLRASSFTIDRQGIQRAKPIEVAGTRIRVASKEDLIVYKLAHFDYKDRADIESIVRRQRRIDLEYITASVKKLAEEAGRPRILDNLAEFMTWKKWN